MSYELSSKSFLKSSENQQSFKGVEVPSIETPKGGGALKSVDEKFSVNAVNGSSSISIPVPVTSARALTPSLALSYNSAAGNGPFGMGWTLSTASISRSTSRKLPLYQDEEESDTFLFSEAEDMVPQFKKDELAHRFEHSIEVQIPFLARFFPKVQVVGVLFGRSTKGELRELSEQFASFLDQWEREGHSKPLLLISSDMNHYASDANTRIIDKLATDALETTDPDALFDAVFRNGVTMCGVLPAFFTLSALKRRGEFNRAMKVGYSTSGDVSGDRERVVGYAGYLFD